MRFLLYTNNEHIAGRWRDILADQGEIFRAASIEQLATNCLDLSPDLVLLHQQSERNGWVQSIQGLQPQMKLVVLSDRPNEDEGLAMLRLGVVGYANTYMSPSRLKEAVRAVVSGSVWVGQQLMARLIRESGKKAAESPQETTATTPLQALSNREHEIALLITEGLSNNSIAERLAITERTVKAHLSSIYSKTGTKGRLNLALLLKK